MKVIKTSDSGLITKAIVEHCRNTGDLLIVAGMQNKALKVLPPSKDENTPEYKSKLSATQFYPVKQTKDLLDGLSSNDMLSITNRGDPWLDLTVTDLSDVEIEEVKVPKPAPVAHFPTQSYSSGSPAVNADYSIIRETNKDFGDLYFELPSNNHGMGYIRSEGRLDFKHATIEPYTIQFPVSYKFNDDGKLIECTLGHYVLRPKEEFFTPETFRAAIGYSVGRFVDTVNEVQSSSAQEEEDPKLFPTETKATDESNPPDTQKEESDS